MRTLRILFVLIALLVLASGASRATPVTTWVGDTLNVQVQSPPPTVRFDGNFTVPTTDIDLSSVVPFTLDLLPNSVTLHVNGPFRGLVDTVFKVTDLSAAPIVNVEESALSTVHLLPGALIFGNNFLQFNLNTLSLTTGQFLTLDVSFQAPGSSIPSPASLPILLSSLLSFVAVLYATKWKKWKTSY